MGEKRNLEEKEVFAPRQFAFGSQTPIASGSTRRRQLQTRFYYPVFRPSTTPFKIISHPACIDEDGGSSGQAMLDSISTWPVFYYDRYESCITIAGADYCVIAADFNPGQLKISKLSSKCVMASCGFQDDVKALQEALSAENLRYESEHNKPMSCPQMCRLFCDFQKCHPNYVFVVLGGLDSEGKGCFFHHYSLVPRVRHSDAAETMAPILKYKLPAKDVLAQLSETEAVKLAQEVFESAINTGDELEIAVISASGVRHIKVDLRASESSQLGRCDELVKERDAARTELSSRIGAYNKAIHALQDLKKNYNDLTSERDDWKTRAEAAEKRVAELEPEVTRLGEQVEMLEGKISVLEGKLDAFDEGGPVDGDSQKKIESLQASLKEARAKAKRAARDAIQMYEDGFGEALKQIAIVHPELTIDEAVVNAGNQAEGSTIVNVDPKSKEKTTIFYAPA